LLTLLVFARSYPKQATYMGGDVNSASSFQCENIA